MMFSGLFGKEPGYAGGMHAPDAMGQAAMGSANAMGNGMPEEGLLGRLMGRWNNMDPMQRQMLMSRIGSGFNMGGFGQQMPQMANAYQPMTPPQPGYMFNPRGR